MVGVISTIQFRMLRQNPVVARLEFARPHLAIAAGNIVPRAAVSRAAVVGTAMRNGRLNRRTDVLQVVRQLARGKARLHGHHPAADIDTHSRRNDCALGGNHAANRRADAPMNIGHRRNPLEDERKLRHVEQLLAGLVFELYSVGPGLDRHTVLGWINVVGFA